VLERYCTWRPQRLLWWESVVMVRKAGIVLLAVLVTNPWFQCAGAALLLGGALIVQERYQPYAERLFNLLEAASLSAAASTAVIAATLLQYDVTAPEYASQPPATMTATQWAVTAVLGAVNLGTLALLAGAWVYLQVREARSGTQFNPHHLPPPPRLLFVWRAGSGGAEGRKGAAGAHGGEVSSCVWRRAHDRQPAAGAPWWARWCDRGHTHWRVGLGRQSNCGAAACRAW
jgi:hypothetical protein